MKLVEVQFRRIIYSISFDAFVGPKSDSKDTNWKKRIQLKCKSLRDHDIVISGSNSSEGFVDAEMKVELREPSLFRDGRGQTTLG
jgi:hypothetical protein